MQWGDRGVHMDSNLLHEMRKRYQKIYRRIRKELPVVVLVLLFAASTGCIQNAVDCPEDTYETSRCPTEKERELHDLAVILLVLANNGHAPPGQVR